MTAKLDIHVASPQELAAAHRNVFDIWSKGLPLEEHLRTRLESPKHGLATWYVGTIDGQVVVSLGCYPLVFAYRGQLVPGFSIGSVYTVKEYRGQGLAPQLIALAEAEKLRSGAKIGSLYCDINPDYYARFGYELCPSLEGWLELKDAAVAAPPAYHLLEISAAERWPELGACMTATTGRCLFPSHAMKRTGKRSCSGIPTIGSLRWPIRTVTGMPMCASA